MHLKPSPVRPGESGSRDLLRHAALLYRDEEEFLARSTEFVESGLAAGEPVLVAVPRPNLDALRSALERTARPPADGAAARSLIRFLDMGDAGRNPGRIIPVAYDFVAAHAPRRTRILGEPVWPGRSAAEYPACVQHEALVNLAFAGSAATILCPYGTDRLGPHAIADAERTHPALVDAAGHRASSRYADPERIAAAFDRPLPDPPVPAPAYAFDAAALPDLRRIVAAAAGRTGMPRDRVADLSVAVNEVATNSVAHAGGHGRLRVWCDEASLVCEVADRGRLTDRLAGRIPAPPDSESGRGLLLVNHLCDLVELHTRVSGTTIRLHMRVTRG